MNEDGIYRPMSGNTAGEAPQPVITRQQPAGGLANEVALPPLVPRVIAALRERFARYGHCPSKEHWEGLVAIAEVIEAQARGTAPADFFYSALPTGMGKTSVLIESVRLLTTDPAYKGVGVVIFLNQLDQISDLIREMGLSRDQFAVETGKANEELNQLGHGYWTRTGNWKSEHPKAQILFTTQQKLFHMLDYQRDFAKLFKYHGKPRQVRVWDEAILPADPMVLTPQEIEEFANLLASHGELTASAELRDWQQSWRPDKPVSTVPLVVLSLGWGSLGLDGPLFKGGTGPTLLKLQGQPVRVCRDAQSGAVVLSYRESLPLHLAPLLILDASGSLRATYPAWAAGRGGLVELPAPGKTYRNLTIYHWDRAAGKAACQRSDTQRDLAKAVAKALAEVPAVEPLLVILRLHEKPYPDLQKRIVAVVRDAGGDPNRLRFLTWGRHMATNQYADIRHVIVVGLLQYPAALNEAHWRAAAKAHPVVNVPAQRVEELRLGEIAHHLFQGVGRGAVRKTVGGDVPAGCRLWCIFSTHGSMKIPQALLTLVLPGAQIVSWEPLGVQLRGGGLRTDARHRFVGALLARLGDKDQVTFEARELEPDGFEAQAVTKKWMRDEAVLRALADKGVVVDAVKAWNGKAKAWRYTLRRQGVSSVAHKRNTS